MPIPVHALAHCPLTAEAVAQLVALPVATRSETRTPGASWSSGRCTPVDPDDEDGPGRWINAHIDQ
ncbi:hypothetical protein [Streptomyces sp. NPDC018352]|uniref:hypothetical protein n=1 Tax=Streptomyces sp. NPDC018352 TaxID=3157194 RepID=UPI0033C807F9